MTDRSVPDLPSKYDPKTTEARWQQQWEEQQAFKADPICLKLGVVELSTKTVSDVLKAHAATYVAGGLLPGASAAYLTRLVELSFLEYLGRAG